MHNEKNIHCIANKEIPFLYSLYYTTFWNISNFITYKT